MRLTLRSFGFTHAGPSESADWVADLRDIPASTVDGFEDSNGLDPALQAAVMETSAAQAWQRKVTFDALVALTDDAVLDFGDDNGVHRSVAFAEVIAAELTADGHTVTLEHRDLTIADAEDSASAHTPIPEEVPRDTYQTVDSMKVTPIATARPWYEIKAASDDVAEVYIYDQIGEDWFGEGITAKRFVEEIKALKVPNIHVHINSPGGSVFDGIAIYNALLRHPAAVTTYIDGLAASIASIVSLAGESVIMAENALFMIHNPSAGAWGTAADMRQMAEILDKIRDTFVTTYVSKTGMSGDDLVAALDAETWYTAAEALDAGFIDEVAAPLQVAASFDLARYGFRHAPSAMREAATKTTGTGGAPATGPSGGAPEPRKADAYIPGIGFRRF